MPSVKAAPISSYKVVVNFVDDVPDTVSVVGEGLEKNVEIGVYVDGVLLDNAKTDILKGEYNQVFLVPSEMKADLLNHSMFTMNAPLFSKTGEIGFCIIDKVKLELRYV